MIKIATMREYVGQTFKDLDDRDSAAVFGNAEFRNCHFDHCSLSITHDPQRRSTVRNVRLLDCTLDDPYADRTIVEDVFVENPKWSGLFQIFGAVFKHVVLRGKFNKLMISNNVLPRSDVNPPYEYENVDAFRVANATYYANVDWALDISQGEFKELDIRGVPGKLIRRDPETQILVTRQRVLEEDWRSLPFRDSDTLFSLDFMLRLELPDRILIAPKRHRKFPLYLEDLKLLREAGIAEPD